MGKRIRSVAHGVPPSMWSSSGRAPPGAMPMCGPGHRLLAHRFDVVPVRTNEEGGVVIPAVLRAQAWRPIVPGACRQRRAIESLDVLAILGRERQVKMRRFLAG